MSFRLPKFFYIYIIAAILLGFAYAESAKYFQKDNDMVSDLKPEIGHKTEPDEQLQTAESVISVPQEEVIEIPKNLTVEDAVTEKGIVYAVRDYKITLCPR